MRKWRKWADRNNLEYDNKTGIVKRAFRNQTISDDGHYWIWAGCPERNEKLCAKVRANVLKMMEKAGK